MQSKTNDFSVRVATVNGTGSQSANNLLYKAIFRMGIGVCGKNLFPSNIQGLATWFNIRVSPNGHQNLLEKEDIAILMNKQTAFEDIEKMGEGTTIVFNSDLIQFQPSHIKKGMVLHPLPVESLSKNITEPKLRTLLKNLFYVGVFAVLYGLDEEVLKGVIEDTFKNKKKAIEANLQALRIGMDYANENFKKHDAFQLKRGDFNRGKILMEGNAATALGCVYGGCTVVAWYPITPASSTVDAIEKYFKQYGHDKEGKARYAVVQAEDELASAGIVIGAGWAGARAATATSGPGISLMSEFIGLAYFAEIPGVFINVQRVSPSTGLPTRTQQGDIQLCATASHGDTKHILLFPSTIRECFEMAQEAFNLADRFQTPVFLISDLDLGMNQWVDKELQYKKRSYDRGKVLDDASIEKVKDYGRYLDRDGDGIPYRTLPGIKNPRGAYFTRGTGHDEYARYSEDPKKFTGKLDRLLKKWNTSKTFVPKPAIDGPTSAKTGVVAYGTTHHAAVEAIQRLKKVPIRYLKLNAYPFTKEVEDFVATCDRVIVIEQNRDGQLRQLMATDIKGSQNKLHSINYYGGFPISSDFVERKLKELG